VNAFVGQYLVYPTQKIENGIFTFLLEIPLALGTVGGLTTLHPLVKPSLKCLKTFRQRINAVVVAGLAQNFAALRSLTTTGIQDGHMKMHLNNILNQFEANDDERILIQKTLRPMSLSAVVDYIDNLRSNIINPVIRFYLYLIKEIK
jgi:hydroxymethylglutaryl-CoA reductase